MALPVKFDHCVVHVSAWEPSNAFYRDVLGAEIVPRAIGFAYRFGDTQLNLHGPGLHPAEVARLPVQPGNSDICFEWKGPIADAIAHLAAHAVPIERGPMERLAEYYYVTGNTEAQSVLAKWVSWAESVTTVNTSAATTTPARSTATTRPAGRAR